MFKFLKHMLQLALSPSNGWEDISAASTPAEKLQRSGLYPMLMLSAASVFVRLVYKPEIGVPASVVLSFVTFMSFCITYFFALSCFKTVVHTFCLTVPSEKKYSTVIIYTLGLLSLASVIYNVLPVRLGLEFILPMLIAVVLCKSTAYIGVDQTKEYSFCGFSILVVIAPPMLIQYFFQWILS